MEKDLICTVAQRIRDYKMVRGDRGLRGLFETFDVDEEDLGHLALHAVPFTGELESTSFAWGILFGLMLAREQTLPEITDDELSELLNG